MGPRSRHWTLFEPQLRTRLKEYRSALWEFRPLAKSEVFRTSSGLNVEDLPQVAPFHSRFKCSFCAERVSTGTFQEGRLKWTD
jgi:hypothetical protein